MMTGRATAAAGTAEAGNDGIVRARADAVRETAAAAAAGYTEDVRLHAGCEPGCGSDGTSSAADEDLREFVSAGCSVVVALTSLFLLIPDRRRRGMDTTRLVLEIRLAAEPGVTPSSVLAAWRPLD